MSRTDTINKPCPTYETIVEVCHDYYYEKKTPSWRIANRIRVLHQLLKGHFNIRQAVDYIVKLDGVYYSNEESLAVYKKQIYCDLLKILYSMNIGLNKNGKFN